MVVALILPGPGCPGFMDARDWVGRKPFIGISGEIVLLSVMVLDQNAYGVSIQEEIQDRLQRNISRGALHAALTRLEDKSYLRSEWGESTAKRGRRRKKMYQVTRKGQAALLTIKRISPPIENFLQVIFLNFTTFKKN